LFKKSNVEIVKTVPINPDLPYSLRTARITIIANIRILSSTNVR